MNNQVAKDQKKRIKVRQDEIKRMAVKALIREQKHPGYRWLNFVSLSKMARRGSRKSIKNRCLLTGRGKSVHRAFKLSRIMLRDLASGGQINGLRKSSW